MYYTHLPRYSSSSFLSLLLALPTIAPLSSFLLSRPHLAGSTSAASRPLSFSERAASQPFVVPEPFFISLFAPCFRVACDTGSVIPTICNGALFRSGDPTAVRPISAGNATLRSGHLIAQTNLDIGIDRQINIDPRPEFDKTALTILGPPAPRLERTKRSVVPPTRRSDETSPSDRPYPRPSWSVRCPPTTWGARLPKNDHDGDGNIPPSPLPETN